MRLTLVLHRGRCENSREFAPGGPWVRAPIRPGPGHTLFGDPVTHWVAEFGDPVAPWLPKAGPLGACPDPQVADGPKTPPREFSHHRANPTVGGNFP